MSRKLSDLINLGTLEMTHIYMQTTTSHEESNYYIDPPKILETLANKGATIEVFPDNNLIISFNDKIWASELPFDDIKTKKLPKDVWVWLSAALGLNSLTFAN